MLAKILNKQLTFSGPVSTFHWHQFLERNEGKYVEIEVVKRARSLKMNALLWVWYGIIGQSLGYSSQEVHEIMKTLLLPTRKVLYKGKQIELPPSTTSLNTTDFGEFMLRVQAEAGQLGISLPSPEDYKKTRDMAPLR